MPVDFPPSFQDPEIPKMSKPLPGSASPVSDVRRSPVTLAVLLACPLLVVATTVPALAQSTGTTAAEGLEEIVITGRRVAQIGGVTEQNAAKSRVTVTGEFLQNYIPGQTFLESLNQVPGVSFTNNDPYGSSGGNLRLRGIDGSRVSLTFDGIPLNDTGNYAIYTNQQIDSELIEAVDVNLGTTDVDSPTASAVGGTINNRTRRPSKEAGGMVSVSAGEYNYRRYFGMLETGEIGPWGTRAYVTASHASNDKFKGPGEIYKRQFNARLFQDLGNGDFVAVAAHFNRNRNNFYRNAAESLWVANGRNFDNLATCTRVPGVAGSRQDEGGAIPGLTGGTENPLNPSACTNYFGLRINPSDTGNIRINSLWNINDSLRLAIDPSFQYTLANGGGTTVVNETPSATANADRRVVGASTALGLDLNGDGDILDSVRFYTPNNTNTRRFGLNASLIWDVSETQRVRFAYAWDYGKHRQTGAFGYLDSSGNPENVFGGRQGRKVPTADGSFLRSRDRYSIAKLNQISAEYRGKFLDEKLTATIGVRAPFFERELNQYCYTQNGSSNVICTTQQPTSVLPNGNVTLGSSTTQYIRPFSGTFKFDDVLPNVGLTYALSDSQTVYVSYASSLSAPRTDNLYTVSRGADGVLRQAIPDPETTDSFDLGWRYRSENLLASVALWKSQFKNRIVSSFDPDLGFSVDRNVGDVDLQGADFQIGWQANDWIVVNGSASYNDSELKQNLQVSATGVLPTAGKRLVETPEWTFGSRVELRPFANFNLGFEGKFVDDRFTTDVNDAKVNSFTIYSLDAGYNFEFQGVKSMRVQLNVFNLFDEEFFGSISSTAYAVALVPPLAGFSPSSPNLALGAPRTVSLSVQTRF
jgi:iron complex outermembrane receptor protein